jgi:rubrerythrin
MQNKKKYLNKLQATKKFILDILFPIQCISCGQADVWLCDKCFKKIELNNRDTCPVCQKNSIYGKTHAW